MSKNISFAKSDKNIAIPSNRINHHGFITGSTGSGKTVTMKVLCEKFLDHGIPVFITDIKGDFSGLIEENKKESLMRERAERLEEQYSPKGYDTNFWDVFRKRGLPIRFSVSDIGPIFLSELLELNDAQSNHLHSIFRFADEEGLLLIDFKDLLSLVQFFASNYKDLSRFGTFAPQTLAAIERKLHSLNYQGANLIFGEPSLESKDIMIRKDGMGIANIVDGRKFIEFPLLYSIFLTKLLSDLYEELEEVGNPDFPKLVLFFDEAHILFHKTSNQLLDKMKQAIRMIRSKGVGIYFVTQSPRDIPEDILGQLGHRILHQMRAFTPKEIKEVKAAAQYLPENPNFNTTEELTQLKIGQALISILQEDGSPTRVEKADVYPPRSDFNPVEDSVILNRIKESSLYDKYQEDYDPISAFEILKERILEKQEKPATEKDNKKKGSLVDTTVNSFLNKMAHQVGRELARNLFGNLKKR
ncbi:MAG: DUF853 family protein [Tissierellia bacterium]|nr:DUF853 family protein [Tissierellia bacterium]